MNIIYNLEIIEIFKNNKNNLNDVLVKIKVKMEGVEIDSKVRADHYFDLELEEPDEYNFTPFNELSQEQVLSWVTDSFNTKLYPLEKPPNDTSPDLSIMDFCKSIVKFRIEQELQNRSSQFPWS